MKLKKYTLIAALALPMAAAAQTASVTFDSDDYKAVSVYDSWENSPFRKGILHGNIAVIDNHLNQVDSVIGEAPNPTEKILAIQRSRFGSNQFGARIDLKNTFSLSPTIQYVHVLINRPIEGRVMLMGLGKHREPDWAGQSPETEQFWEISTTTITPNKWTDAVFAIKGVRCILWMTRQEKFSAIVCHHHVRARDITLGKYLQIWHRLDVFSVQCTVTAVRHKESVVESTENRIQRFKNLMLKHAKDL